MINELDVIPDDDARLKVIDGLVGLDLRKGEVNTANDVILANVKHAVGLQYPQVRRQPPNVERVAIVGSGASLDSTLDELRQAVFEGAKVVTLNGAYQWCIERNIRPATQIVLDARASNARFLHPAVPQCRYLLASQCAPETWAAVAGREHVWVFHAADGPDTPVKRFLDEYYLGQWLAVGGGVTVATRAIWLLRELGYLRFDLFGIDSCWLGERHHAFEQPENANDRACRVTVHPSGHEDLAKTFTVSPWHVKQFEDFLHLIRLNGTHFLLNIHGDGLLAYALRSAAYATEFEMRDEMPTYKGR